MPSRRQSNGRLALLVSNNVASVSPTLSDDIQQSTLLDDSTLSVGSLTSAPLTTTETPAHEIQVPAASRPNLVHEEGQIETPNEKKISSPNITFSPIVPVDLSTPHVARLNHEMSTVCRSETPQTPPTSSSMKDGEIPSSSSSFIDQASRPSSLSEEELVRRIIRNAKEEKIRKGRSANSHIRILHGFHAMNTLETAPIVPIMKPGTVTGDRFATLLVKIDGKLSIEQISALGSGHYISSLPTSSMSEETESQRKNSNADMSARIDALEVASKSSPGMQTRMQNTKMSIEDILPRIMISHDEKAACHGCAKRLQSLTHMTQSIFSFPEVVFCTRAADSLRKRCKKKFCVKCLREKFNIDFMNLKQLDSWLCPGCTGQCACRACLSSRERLKAREDSVAFMSPSESTPSKPDYGLTCHSNICLAHDETDDEATEYEEDDELVPNALHNSLVTVTPQPRKVIRIMSYQPTSLTRSQSDFAQKLNSTEATFVTPTHPYALTRNPHRSMYSAPTSDSDESSPITMPSSSVPSPTSENGISGEESHDMPSPPEFAVQHSEGKQKRSFDEMENLNRMSQEMPLLKLPSTRDPSMIPLSLLLPLSCALYSTKPNVALVPCKNMYGGYVLSISHPTNGFQTGAHEMNSHSSSSMHSSPTPLPPTLTRLSNVKVLAKLSQPSPQQLTSKKSQSISTNINPLSFPEKAN